RTDDVPRTVTASATSGLPVTFTARGACEVDGAVLRPSAVGPCAVTAEQKGNGNYRPAPAVVRSLVVADARQASPEPTRMPNGDLPELRPGQILLLGDDASDTIAVRTE